MASGSTVKEIRKQILKIVWLAILEKCRTLWQSETCSEQLWPARLAHTIYALEFATRMSSLMVKSRNQHLMIFMRPLLTTIIGQYWVRTSNTESWTLLAPTSLWQLTCCRWPENSGSLRGLVWWKTSLFSDTSWGDWRGEKGVLFLELLREARP